MRHMEERNDDKTQCNKLLKEPVEATFERDGLLKIVEIIMTVVLFWQTECKTDLQQLSRMEKLAGVSQESSDANGVVFML